MEFLVPNYSCLQSPRLRGYRPQIPFISVLCPQLNLLNSPPQPKKIPGYATRCDLSLPGEMIALVHSIHFTVSSLTFPTT